MTLCTLVEGEITITQGQKFANVGRLLSIRPGGLLYIVAIYLILIYGPWYLHAWKSLMYDKEQWSLWLPNHLIMPRQWYESVTLFDIGNGEVFAKLTNVILVEPFTLLAQVLETNLVSFETIMTCSNAHVLTTIYLRKLIHVWYPLLILHQPLSHYTNLCKRPRIMTFAFPWQIG